MLKCKNAKMTRVHISWANPSCMVDIESNLMGNVILYGTGGFKSDELSHPARRVGIKSDE